MRHTEDALLGHFEGLRRGTMWGETTLMVSLSAHAHEPSFSGAKVHMLVLFDRFQIMASNNAGSNSLASRSNSVLHCR